MSDYFTIKRIRRVLGLSTSSMAKLFGLSGANATDEIRKIENGIKPVPGPLSVISHYLSQSLDCDENILPRFLFCESLEAVSQDKVSGNIVFHTRFPRFLAWVIDNDIIEQINTPYIIIDDLEAFAIGMWIDDASVCSRLKIEEILIDAVELMQQYNDILDSEEF